MQQTLLNIHFETGNFGERSKGSLGCEDQAVTFGTQASLPLVPLFCAWRHAVQAASIYLAHPKGAFRPLPNGVTYATDKCLWLFNTMNYHVCFELYIWEENQPVDWKPQLSAGIKAFHFSLLFASRHELQPSSWSRDKRFTPLILLLMLCLFLGLKCCYCSSYIFHDFQTVIFLHEIWHKMDRKRNRY